MQRRSYFDGDGRWTEGGVEFRGQSMSFAACSENSRLLGWG